MQEYPNVFCTDAGCDDFGIDVKFNAAGLEFHFQFADDTQLVFLIVDDQVHLQRVGKRVRGARCSGCGLDAHYNSSA